MMRLVSVVAISLLATFFGQTSAAASPDEPTLPEPALPERTPRVIATLIGGGGNGAAGGISADVRTVAGLFVGVDGAYGFARGPHGGFGYVAVGPRVSYRWAWEETLALQPMLGTRFLSGGEFDMDGGTTDFDIAAPHASLRLTAHLSYFVLGVEGDTMLVGGTRRSGSPSIPDERTLSPVARASLLLGAAF